MVILLFLTIAISSGFAEILPPDAFPSPDSSVRAAAAWVETEPMAALTLLRQSSEQNPAVIYYKAVAHFSIGNHNEARRLFGLLPPTQHRRAHQDLEALLSSTAASTPAALQGEQAILQKARFRLESNQPEKARDLLAHLLESSPTRIDLVFEYLGIAQNQLGFYPDAITYFERSLEQAPFRTAPLQHLAMSYRMLGQHAMDQHLQDKIHLLEGRSPSPLTTMHSEPFLIHLWMQNPQESELQLFDILQILWRQRRFKQFALQTESFLSQSPLQWPDLEERLATAYQRMWDSREKRVLSEPSLLKELQQLLAQQQYLEVLAFFQSLPENLTPSNELKMVRVEALLNTGRIREAERSLETLLREEFSPMAVKTRLARIAYEQDRYDEALNLYTQILGMNPSPETLFKIAEILSAMGAVQQAREIYENLLNGHQDPDVIRNATWSLRNLKNKKGSP